MKLTPLLIPLSFLLAACAEDPLINQVPGKFEQGIKGEGTLYQPNRADDPYVQDKTPPGT